jgi:hypothetical protein
VLPTYATTIAGAMLPVLMAALGTFMKLYFRRLEKQWKLGHKESLEGQKEITERLSEAEALIRGDLKNGVKAKLDSIDEKVTKVTERQGQSTAQNLQDDAKA